MPSALFLQTLTEDPVTYVSVVVGVVVSIVLHELGHGVAALWQGDDTPRVSGHMTWDPLVHMGALSLGLLMVVGIAFGAMPVDRTRFRSRRGDLYVAAAGPATNLLLAGVALTLLGVWWAATGPAAGGLARNAQYFLQMLGTMNIVLCLFNLLPIPPLDGSTVLASLLPGYRRFVSNPDNQPFLMGGLVVAFVLAGPLIEVAYAATGRYLALFGPG